MLVLVSFLFWNSYFQKMSARARSHPYLKNDSLHKIVGVSRGVHARGGIWRAWLHSVPKLRTWARSAPKNMTVCSRAQRVKMTSARTPRARVHTPKISACVLARSESKLRVRALERTARQKYQRARPPPQKTKLVARKKEERNSYYDPLRCSPKCVVCTLNIASVITVFGDKVHTYD